MRDRLVRHELHHALELPDGLRDSGRSRLYAMPRLNQVWGSVGSCFCAFSSSAMPALPSPARSSARP